MADLEEYGLPMSNNNSKGTTDNHVAEPEPPRVYAPSSAFPDDTSNKGDLFRACLGEFLALLMFVFLGCGSVAATGEFLVDDQDFSVQVNVARVLPIATTFGLTIVILAFNLGPISGGHVNPAVTFALMLQRKVSPLRMVLYWISQSLGSILGACLLWAALSGASYNPAPGTNVTVPGFRVGVDVIPAVGRPPFYLGANQLNPVISTSNGLLLEIMATSFLVGTVFSTAVDTRSLGGVGQLAPIPIGFSVWVAHLVLIPWTGCGINPARTLGPAIVNSFAGIDTWGDANLVIYFLGPMLGATLTVGVMHVLWGGMAPPPASTATDAKVLDENDDE